MTASIAVLPQPITATRRPTGTCRERPRVDLFDELEGVDHLGQILAGNAEPVGAAEADADEDGVVVPHEVGGLHVAAELDAAAELHAEPLDHRHLRRGSPPAASCSRRCRRC